MATTTLQQRLQDLATRIATECKSIRTLLNGNASDNSALTTNAKNLVGAINEVKALVAANSNGAVVDDATSSSATETYSVNKILAVVADAKAAVKSDILGGADAAYDTLKELEALLQGDDASIATLNAAIGNRVRIDTAAQGLTTTQQQNARTNIGAYGAPEIGAPDTDFVAVFVAGLS